MTAEQALAIRDKIMGSAGAVRIHPETFREYEEAMAADAGLPLGYAEIPMPADWDDRYHIRECGHFVALDNTVPLGEVMHEQAE